jgi:propanediol dehydratase small subunit
LDLYPLIEKHPELIKSKTGKSLADITLESVTNDMLTIDDLSISKETLILQAKVALDNGREQLAENFVRASELINVPDDVILKIYNQLRPYRATKEELLATADVLEKTYQAPICANFIRETLAVYETRDILRKE